MKIFLFFLTWVIVAEAAAQRHWIQGMVLQGISGVPIPGATISVPGGKFSTVADEQGRFRIQIGTGVHKLRISAVGFRELLQPLSGDTMQVLLQPNVPEMEEIVISGTMRPVLRSASPVPVELYTVQFFRKNPSPSIFDALQMVNGVRPQLNCNVCNTGDIHINGLEGPYTMILIDGMPIVSSLASVYGLQGIPNALVERIEIVKGPASSLYGSEAIGGLINIITRSPAKAPGLSLEYHQTSWREQSVDVGFRWSGGPRSQSLVGLSYYNFTHRFDQNKDNFTDVTLQNRISLFEKTNWQRKDNLAAALAMRFIAEDRAGGEMQWSKKFRGTDSVYGEQISTARAELIGNYQFPAPGKMMFSFSGNVHRQRSAYGKTIFNADQRVLFGQLTWEKKAGGDHQLLSGIVARYTWYDDNTPATAGTSKNMPDRILLPGVFLQDEWKFRENHILLSGLRYDYDKRHGNIFTPRLAWKWSLSSADHLRLNAGTGFRVVNLFTEDHAALTGARDIEIKGNLKPERSVNVNLNYTRKFLLEEGFINLETSAWYTYFFNRILPDYNSDPDKIIYANLEGYAQSTGLSLNMDAAFNRWIRANLGFTLMDVSLRQQGKAKQRQLLTENWSGTWALTCQVGNSGWAIDYTGNVYGPMLLPLISAMDPRKPLSPVWSIQNLQGTKKWKNGWECFGGIKNLLDFTPAKNQPFLIARSADPFDKSVTRNAEGRVVATPDNPYALSFDPNYVYAPNQGLRFYLGFRFRLQP